MFDVVIISVVVILVLKKCPLPFTNEENMNRVFSFLIF